jgi:hypothetical protein
MGDSERSQMSDPAATGDGGVLDLDALYGQVRPIVVRWQGQEYALRRPEAFTPVEWLHYRQLQKRAAQLNETSDDEAAMREMDALLSDEVALMCGELADAQLPFAVRVAVIQHYMAQVAPAGGGAEDASAPKARRAGRTRTPASRSGTGNRSAK